MIISGIYKEFSNQSNNDLLKRLLASTKKKIKKKEQHFNDNYLHLITGNTSSDINQGNILKTENSLLVGKIFCKDNYKSITLQDLELIESNKSFVDKYWGNYLLFKKDDNKKTLTILRDPVGQLPLFYTKLSTEEIVFSSEISVIWDVLKTKPSYNWSYFSSYVVHSFITTKQTPFEGIYELLHGCELNISKESIEESVVWNPLDYISEYNGLEDIQHKIIDTTTNVMKCWTSDFDNIFLDFSGGLDSSSLFFLLNKLLKPEQQLHPVNFFHPEVQSSDEREHAWKIAKEIGIDLIEFDNSKSLPLTPFEGKLGFKPNWPTSSLTHLSIEQNIFDLSKSCENTVSISGHGGDHIFLCPPPVKSLCDYFMEKGTKNFNSKLKEISSIYRKPLFPILKEMLKGVFSHYLLHSYKQQSLKLDKYRKAPWFNEEIYKLEKTIPPHPFFTTKTTKILPGKFNFIDGIYNGLSTIKGEVRNYQNPIFYPLFSQPLLELSLSIPTYESYSKGYDRYPFRKAISEYFKTNNVWRKDKGETSGIMQRGLKHNEKYILELCLEGNIVKTGLIDKNLLYKNINGMMNGQTDTQWPVSSLISAEIFMRFWD